MDRVRSMPSMVKLPTSSVRANENVAFNVTGERAASEVVHGQNRAELQVEIDTAAGLVLFRSVFL